MYPRECERVRNPHPRWLDSWWGERCENSQAVALLLDKKLEYKVQAGSEVCAPKVYVVPVCVCVHLYIYGHVCVCGGQRSLLDISLDCSSPYFFDTVSLIEPGTHQFGQASKLKDPTDPPYTPTPPASSDSLVLGLQVCAALPGFCLDDVYACVCLPICVCSCVHVGTCTITQVWSSEDSLRC